MLGQMTACQAQIDRLIGVISAESGVKITRGKDGLYLFGSDRDDDFVIGVGPGGDENYVTLQAVIGTVPAEKEAGVLRGLLQANTLLAGMGWPVFTINRETNTILSVMSNPRLDDQGVERDAAWLNALILVFLNAAGRARELVDTGSMRLSADADGIEDDGDTDEIFIRI